MDDLTRQQRILIGLDVMRAIRGEAPDLMRAWNHRVVEERPGITMDEVADHFGAAVVAALQ